VGLSHPREVGHALIDITVVIRDLASCPTVERNLFIQSNHCCSVTIAQPQLTIHNCLSTLGSLKKSELLSLLTYSIVFNHIQYSIVKCIRVLDSSSLCFSSHVRPTHPARREVLASVMPLEEVTSVASHVLMFLHKTPQGPFVLYLHLSVI
jgi:hypothetical protein